MYNFFGIFKVGAQEEVECTGGEENSAGDRPTDLYQQGYTNPLENISCSMFIAHVYSELKLSQLVNGPDIAL